MAYYGHETERLCTQSRGVLQDSLEVVQGREKDRATRFGFRYLEALLAQQARSIEVVNMAEDSQADLLADLVAIIYSFCARLYGQRRAKRKTEKITAELEAND